MMKMERYLNTIWIVPIEPIDQRYTKQWYDNIPALLKTATDGYDIHTIPGHMCSSTTTPGAFLEFALTNAYKASQVETISHLFHSNAVKSGDKFLVTDAWHFGIIAIKYMSELLDIPVEIHSIWHAGSYDPTDILGMKMTKNWSTQAERTFFYASDYNYFATNFHKDMFLKNLGILMGDKKAIRSGQPHNQIIGPLIKYSLNGRNPLIMFPHRLNSDKQPEIASDLRTTFDMCYHFEITQEQNLSKERYYAALGRASVIFSCALHENLGISVMEGCLAGAIPVVPDRASYSEMYLDCFKYPSEWTSSWAAYIEHKGSLKKFISDRIEHYPKYYGNMMLQKNILIDRYLTATEMINRLIQ
jgi:hypothetical protein